MRFHLTNRRQFRQQMSSFQRNEKMGNLMERLAIINHITLHIWIWIKDSSCQPLNSHCPWKRHGLVSISFLSSNLANWLLVASGLKFGCHMGFETQRVCLLFQNRKFLLEGPLLAWVRFWSTNSALKSAFLGTFKSAFAQKSAQNSAIKSDFLWKVPKKVLLKVHQ